MKNIVNKTMNKDCTKYAYALIADTDGMEVRGEGRLETNWRKILQNVILTLVTDSVSDLYFLSYTFIVQNIQ